MGSVGGEGFERGDGFLFWDAERVRCGCGRRCSGGGLSVLETTKLLERFLLSWD